MGIIFAILLIIWMGFLRAKSEFNQSSADLLYGHTYYAPSVHCAYYSCFQLLKYLIKEKINISYDQQENEISSDTRLTSHSYVQKIILAEIYKREHDPNVFREVRTKLKDLQELRIKSDYKNIQIDESLSRRAIQYSNDLRSYLLKTIS